MNLYGLDYTLMDLGYGDPTFVESLSSSDSMIMDRRLREKEEENLLKISNAILKNSKRNSSPPKHRHDGTSPLPLGMDWSPPPRNWDGPNTIWPHDSHTGWSYSATIPSWSIFSESEGSEPVVFYRVQVGLQSSEGVTTTREVLKRFSDFLKLSSDLKQSFSRKKMPSAPPKGLLRKKSTTLLEERRCSLEDWMVKVLSDIDISRSAAVACFLELEAVVRSSFSESNHHVLNVNLSSQNNNEATVSVAFDENNSSTPPKEFNKGKDEKYLPKFDERIDLDKFGDTSPKCSESVEASESLDTPPSSGLQLPHDKMVFQMDEEQKMNKLLNTMQQRLVTSKNDVEDLIARLNQELAVRQYLATKVKDLETELESTKKCSKENLEKAILIEREKFTQMQWDMEEVKRKCMDMELTLKAEQDGKDHAEETTNSIIKENEKLRQELNSTREQLQNLQKCHEEADLKSKGEVKSLRISQSELRQELDRVEKEKMEFEARLEKEKIKTECIDAANTKLLHECEILRSRLEECNVNFLFGQDNKLKVDAWSQSDALDKVATFGDCAGLLLEEARLLAQDVATPTTNSSHGSGNVDELRKMLTDVLIDNAILRKQATSIMQCAFSMKDTSCDNTRRR